MVSPKYDILGWYSTGRNVKETYMQIHKSVSCANIAVVFICIVSNAASFPSIASQLGWTTLETYNTLKLDISAYRYILSVL